MDINARRDDGVTPLLQAVLDRNEKLVEKLLQEKADPSIPDGQLQTPLHWAAQNSMSSTCLRLIEAKAGLDLKDAFDRSPIFWVVQRGMTLVFEKLIEQGADLDLKSKGGNTLLHWASLTGDLSIVTRLFEEKEKAGKASDVFIKNDSDETALDVAKGAQVVAFLQEAQTKARLAEDKRKLEEGGGAATAGSSAAVDSNPFAKTTPAGQRPVKKMTIKLKK